MQGMKLFNVNVIVKHKKSKYLHERTSGRENQHNRLFFFSKETNMATMPSWEYQEKPESGCLFQGIGYIVMPTSKLSLAKEGEVRFGCATFPIL